MTPIEVKKVVENYTGIEDLSTKNRKQHNVFARWIYFDMCHRYIRNATLETIGKTIGFDHATVIYGLKMIKQELKYGNFMYEYQYQQIKNHLSDENDNETDDIRELKVLNETIDRILSDKNSIILGNWAIKRINCI